LKSNGVAFDRDLFFVTAIRNQPGFVVTMVLVVELLAGVWLQIIITIYGSDFLILLAYAPSMPLILSLPLSMACDDSDGCVTMQTSAFTFLLPASGSAVLKIIVCSFVAKLKSNEVAFDCGIFFVTAIRNEPSNDIVFDSKKIPSLVKTFFCSLGPSQLAMLEMLLFYPSSLRAWFL
nr:hypothetical protein [Tanacetum cinerariifolium]